jgi:1-acyl-sn-glycerol-3-phosphate acyltransferase
MLRLPKGPLRGLVLMTLFVLNTLLIGVPIVIVSLFKVLVPITAFRRLVGQVLVSMAEAWISVNGALLRLTQSLHWQISGIEGLNPRGWYLVIANHRSWVDILALQTVLNRRIPFLKFFIKDSLKWVPVLGMAWWALDMPFMKRYSKQQLARRPELRGADLKATQRACEKFRHQPTSIINFVEGTRFTADKQAATRSPYQYLLRPKAGGVAFVLDALGPILSEMLDVTIAYPDGDCTMWDLCCGRVSTIVVDVRRRTLPVRQAAGDYVGDGEFRGRFQEWLGVIWAEKDARLARILDDQLRSDRS